jgi:hypothetical protein
MVGLNSLVEETIVPIGESLIGGVFDSGKSYQPYLMFASKAKSLP